jgi:hypothetical protein
LFCFSCELQLPVTLCKLKQACLISTNPLFMVMSFTPSPLIRRPCQPRRSLGALAAPPIACWIGAAPLLLPCSFARTRRGARRPVTDRVHPSARPPGEGTDSYWLGSARHRPPSPRTRRDLDPDPANCTCRRSPPFPGRNCRGVGWSSAWIRVDRFVPW